MLQKLSTRLLVFGIFQAHQYSQEAYIWDPKWPAACRLIGEVFLEDGYFTKALQALSYVTGASSDSKSELCVSKASAVIEKICRKDWGNKLMSFVKLLDFDGVKRALLRPASELIKYSPNEDSLRKEGLDKAITLSQLCSLPAVPSSMVTFYKKVNDLYQALTLSPPGYSCPTSTFVSFSPPRNEGNIVEMLRSSHRICHSDSERPQLNIVIGSWNILANAFYHINPTKLNNLAKIAEQEGMALIALQECHSNPSAITKILSGCNCPRFFTGWIYCQACTGQEAAGFLYNPKMLDLITGPAAFPHKPKVITGNDNISSIKGNFVRPPVIASFQITKPKTGDRDHGELHTSLLVVCNVHLKSSEDNRACLPQENVVLLASKDVQKWITDATSDAARVMHSCNQHCVMIIGDFNLAGTAKNNQNSDHQKCTYPGLAWDGLDRQGFTRLLHANDTTSFGPPVTVCEAHAFDNALIRFTNSSKGKNPTAEARVCDIAAKEISDMGCIRRLYSPPSGSLDTWDNFVSRETADMLKRWKHRLLLECSDHKPIAVHLSY